MNDKLSGYELTRQWHNFAFENPDLIRPAHGALYFYILDQANRFGWKDKFGLPASMAMEATGMKSYNTYIKTFRDLVGWGFIDVVEWSKNQYTSNVIALSKIDKARDKALDKASAKHLPKQVQSTYQSTDSILKQRNKETIKQRNKETNPTGGNDLQSFNNSNSDNILLSEKPTLIKSKKDISKNLFNECKKTFNDYYLDTIGTEFYFDAKEAGHLKPLLLKIKTKIMESGTDLSEKTLHDVFEIFIMKASQDNWIQNNFSISILNSKFNETYSKIKKGVDTEQSTRESMQNFFN